MSGGVDSSVAAALLKEQGYELVGVTLHLWDADGVSKVGRCCAPEDREDARRSCDALGIPHYVIDERAAFRATVVDPFVEAYRNGTTPSPCVTCNQQVKLGRLVELADTFGCDLLATGHYARIEQGEGGLVLRRGRDASKDQSYFLFGVPEAVLGRMIFPLGELAKTTTRAEGQRLGVPNWQKKDSQELCFVPDGDIGGFVARESGEAPRGGRIVDVGGQELAKHDGVHRFTIGQRRGLGVGGGPVRYVLKIVPETADVVVGGDEELASTGLEVDEALWLGGIAPREAFEGAVQIRYRHGASPGTITPTEHGFAVHFATPQRAVAPGQAAVVYVGDRVVGGGTIRRRIEAAHA